MIVSQQKSAACFIHEHGQWVEGSDSPPLLCSCETSPRVLHPLLVSLHLKDMELLDQVQKRTEAWQVFSLEKEKLVWRPHRKLPVFEGVLRRGREVLLVRSCSDRTRNNRYKMKQGKCTLDVWKEFFTVQVMRHQNMLPRSVDAPPQAIFRASQDKALNNLVKWDVSLSTVRGLELDDL